VQAVCWGSPPIEKFLSPGWEVIGVSRRKPELPSSRDVEFLAVDLRDEETGRAAFEPLTDITHIAYTALHEKPRAGRWVVEQGTDRHVGFPGGPSFVWEAADAGLVAVAPGRERGVQHHQGDVFEWRNVWPALARTLDVETGPDMPTSGAAYLKETRMSGTGSSQGTIFARGT
jgi:hypothetical protein